jgi:hypothetical protein
MDPFVLGMLGAAPRPPEGALRVKKRETLRFYVDGAADRQLVVLCNSVDGWELLCPSALHDGRLEGLESAFPREKAFTFGQENIPTGEWKVYRFLFVDLPAGAPLEVRSVAGDLSAILAPEEVGRLGLAVVRAKALAQDKKLAPPRWRNLYVAVGDGDVGT